MTQLPRNGEKPGKPVGGYDEAFKRQAVGLVGKHGWTMSEVARELGITVATLTAWRKRHGRVPGVEAAELTGRGELRAENARLRAEVQRLQLREAILRKTLGILSEALRNVTSESGRPDGGRPQIIRPAGLPPYRN